jgi:hypothetical protein
MKELGTQQIAKKLEKVGIVRRPKPNIVKLYHASKISTLEKLGVKSGNFTLNSICEKSEEVYIGTKDYVYNQYLKYTPSGTYYIYEVTVDLSRWYPLPTGGQWKSSEEISPHNVRLFDVCEV